MKKKYEVDWQDQWYPVIAETDPDSAIGDTYATVKKELIDSITHKIKHWQIILKQVRKIRKQDIPPHVETYLEDRDND